MKTERDAIALCRNVMVRIGKLADRSVSAVISDMNQPLGSAIGQRPGK